MFSVQFIPMVVISISYYKLYDVFGTEAPRGIIPIVECHAVHIPTQWTHSIHGRLHRRMGQLHVCTEIS